MKITEIRAALHKLRTPLDTLDHRRFNKQIAPPGDIRCEDAAKQVKELLNREDDPLKFNSGITEVVRNLDTLKSLDTEELSLLAEQHLTSTAGYMKMAMHSKSIQDFQYNYAVAISHSTAATLLLYTALNNTHNLDSSQNPKGSILKALKDYSNALGEHDLNPNLATTRNYEICAENVRRTGLEFYRHVKVLSAPMFIYYPADADYTEGRVDYGSLITSTEKHPSNPKTLRILAISYLALARLH